MVNIFVIVSKYSPLDLGVAVDVFASRSVILLVINLLPAVELRLVSETF